MSDLFPIASRAMHFPKAVSVLAACTLLAWASPLSAQDDSTAAPPAPDEFAPAPGTSPGNSDDSASFQTFYDSLASQGTWVQSSDYGYVWQPNVNDPNWAPYTAGHWVYTDDGWTWVSDESWGWATYHYGRWVNLDGVGWCWVPGYTWAPAWVSWRYGDGFCGWAPLPPDSFVGIDYSDGDFSLDVGFHIGGDCDDFYGIGAGCYIFLPVGCLGYSDYHHYYRNRYDNYGIINRTKNVTNLNVTRNGTTAGGSPSGEGSFHHVTTGGPSLAEVNAVSQTPVARVSLVRANQPGGGGTLANNSLALYAPHVNAGAGAQPAHVAASIGMATVNRGTDITRPLAVNPHLVPSPATEAQVRQAQAAQSNAPESAKIMTSTAMVRPVLQGPIGSLTPIARQETSSRAAPVYPNATYHEGGSSPAPGVAPTPRTFPGADQGESAVPYRSYSPGTTYPSAPSVYQPHPTAPPASAPAASGAYRSSNGESGGSVHTQSGGGGGGGSSHAAGATGSGYQQNH